MASEGWSIPEDSSVSADAPDFFHVRHVPIKQQTIYRSMRRSASSDLMDDPRFLKVQKKSFAQIEREKNFQRMVHTDVGDLVQQKKISRVQGQDFPVLFPHGVNHRQALQLDPEGDGMKPLPEKTMLPHSIHSMSDMCGGRKPKHVFELATKAPPTMPFKPTPKAAAKKAAKVETARQTDIASVRELY
jgi:hypothetical protein